MSLVQFHPDVVIIAKVSAALFTTGYGAVGILSFVPATARGARASWPSLFSATLSFSTILAAFLFGGLVLSSALILIAARIGYEAAFVGFGADNRARRIALGASVLMALASLGVLSLSPVDIAFWLPIAFGITALLRLLAQKRANIGVKSLLSLLLYPVLPLMMFIAAANSMAFGALVLGSYVLVETFDSYALLGGKALGKTKAFPTLSPRKTVEGLAIGAVMLMATSAAVALILRPHDLWLAITIAVVAGVLTIIGDLAASHLKRTAGVKDFPPILKQQGGLLDIIDAWITTGAGIALIMIWL